MAYTDLTRNNRFAQKKQESYFAPHIREAQDGTLATGNYLLGYLPPGAVVIDAYLWIKTPSDALTATVALGTTEGGAEIMAATTLTSAGSAGTLVAEVDTGSELPIYATVVNSGDGTDVADYVIVVLYLEYDKNTGEYTRMTTASA